MANVKSELPTVELSIVHSNCLSCGKSSTVIARYEDGRMDKIVIDRENEDNELGVIQFTATGCYAEEIQTACQRLATRHRAVYVSPERQEEIAREWRARMDA